MKKRFVLASALALVVACSDAPTKEGDPSYCRVDETNRLIDECPDDLFCAAVGAEEGRVVFDCVEPCSSNEECEDDLVCRLDESARLWCQPPYVIPECPWDADEVSCPDGCLFVADADRYTIDATGMCAVDRDVASACVAPNPEPCFNGCPGVIAWYPVDATTGVAIFTENGVATQGWEQSQSNPEFCPALGDEI